MRGTIRLITASYNNPGRNLKTYWHEKDSLYRQIPAQSLPSVTVFVIGAGGTGSQVATGLARISVALQALGHPGLHVTVFDPDTVTEANIRTPAVQRIGTRIEQGCGTCDPHQPFFRLLVDIQAEELPARLLPGFEDMSELRGHEIEVRGFCALPKFFFCRSLTLTAICEFKLKISFSNFLGM